MRKRLGECLVQAGLITDDDLRVALADQKRTREHLGVILTRNGVVTDSQIAQTVALQLGLPFVTLDRDPDPATLSLIPEAEAIQYGIVALTLHRHVLTVAMADPLLLGIVQDLEARTGYRVRQVVAERGAIAGFITRAYSSARTHTSSLVVTGHVDIAAHDADEQLEAALEHLQRPGITEIRFESVENGGVVSSRLDGALQIAARLSSDAYDSVIARLKQRGCMEPSEHRLAQDGRLRLTEPDGSIRTIRIGVRRTASGEMAVLRPEDGAVTLPLASLGLSEVALDTLRRLSTQSGLLLLGAPPASGASTTARSLVAAFGERVHLSGIVHDTESAGAALSSARDGQLVVATIQADDTASAVDRLVGLSWSPGLVGEVLAGVVVQRLTRRLCDRCRRSSSTTEGYEPAGCAQCEYAGFRGRVGIFEVLPVANDRRQLIAQGGTVLREASIADGMPTLADDGLAKVRAGVARWADVSRVVDGLAGARRTCPACGSVVQEDQADCVYCRHRLLEACRFCGNALRPEWGTCPYCTRSVAAGTLLERLS